MSSSFFPRTASFVWLCSFASAAAGQAPAVDRRIAPEVAPAEARRRPVVFEGLVLEASGTPAEGALVTSSAGGAARTDAAGHYRLEAPVPTGAERVQLTAVGGAGRNHVASASVALSGAASVTWSGALTLASGACASPSWIPTFGEAPSTDGEVHALAVFDDGGGPALYAGGSFTTAGLSAANRIAKWDGTTWSALGTGTDGEVRALAVYDDGGGPALYAGGLFTSAGGGAASRIAKWDGTSWSAVGSGMDQEVRALVVHDDGGGAALFAGGAFTSAGGGAANRIAKWDGASWSTLGSGMNETVHAFALHDDGGGAALFAGGAFTSAGGGAANRIAKWDGATWSALGVGTNGDVRALAVYDDGGGAALYAGGLFSTAGGIAAARIARWRSATWSTLGSGIGGGPLPQVLALSAYDDGGGAKLYAGGGFTNAGGSPASYIAAWNGASWTALGAGMFGSAPIVHALAVFDPGSGSRLFAGGAFVRAGGVVRRGIAGWDGASWSTLGRGLNDRVSALGTYDDGSGRVLVVGGLYSTAGDVATNRIGRWTSSGWGSFGTGLPLNSPFAAPWTLLEWEEAGNPVLFMGGYLYTVGGVSVDMIARWDGSAWSQVGAGFQQNFTAPGGVFAQAAFDDGSGPAPHAGGLFDESGGEFLGGGLAKWNGTSWTGLVDELAFVRALETYDDGGGTALYAGGDLDLPGPGQYLSKWDGVAWSALGTGPDSFVSALEVFDDGSGPALYVGGDFTTAGGVAASRIARWDGSSWSALGSGVDDDVQALLTFDDGSGPALYAAGEFTLAGGVAANRIARWDGSSWSALGSGLNERVWTLEVYDDGDGPALFVGGEFTRALDSGDSYLAKWGGGCDTYPPTLSCQPVSAMDRFGTAAGEQVFFSASVVDNRDPAPMLSFVPPSGSFFPRGTTQVTCTATDASGNQSVCQFPVTVHLKARPR